MKMIVMRSTPDGYSLDEREGYPPEEMEWRIVEAAEELFPNDYQWFAYDESQYPVLDIVEPTGKVSAKIFFEKE